MLREEGLEKGRLTPRPADVRFWRAVYDEKVARADAQFAHFLAEFDALGVTGKTLFVLTSDHGTELYEHDRLDHGFTLYDEQVRVPLVLKLPDRAAAGAAVDARVSSIDLMPTVLDLLDVAVPERVRAQLRGRSLVPAMRGEPLEARDAFAETDYREYTFKRSVVAPDGWKLIYTLETKARELYDLTADPGEQTNLAGAAPARADELERRLFAHFKAIGHDLTAQVGSRAEPRLQLAGEVNVFVTSRERERRTARSVAHAPGSLQAVSARGHADVRAAAVQNLLHAHRDRRLEARTRVVHQHVRRVHVRDAVPRGHLAAGGFARQADQPAVVARQVVQGQRAGPHVVVEAVGVRGRQRRAEGDPRRVVRAPARAATRACPAGSRCRTRTDRPPAAAAQPRGHTPGGTGDRAGGQCGTRSWVPSSVGRLRVRAGRRRSAPAS